MERPRSSYGFRERRSISSLWRPRTGIDSTHTHTTGQVTVMSSTPESPLAVSRDLQDWATAGPFDSFEHQTEGVTHHRDRPLRTFSASGPAPTEVKTLGRLAAKKARLSALFTSKPRETQHPTEDRPQQSRHMHSTSWLRRAKSSTLRLGKKPFQESESTQEVVVHNYHSSDLQLSRQTSIDPNQVPGGAAARAAAAASKERGESSRSPVVRDLSKLKDLDLGGDSESGIGIELKDSLDHLSESEPSLPRLDPASLPPELFEHIVSYLDAESIVNVELVSRKWHETASSYRVWRGIFGAEFRRRKSLSKEVPSHIGGLGLGSDAQEQNWKQMWKARKALDARWKDGYAAAIYLEGHKDSVYCVQFDEDKIITGSRDRTIRVWDARTYRCLRVLGMLKFPPNNQTSTPIGNRMNRQKPFRSVNPSDTSSDNRSDHRSINHSGSVLCLQFDKTTMVTGSSDTTLIIWDIAADYLPTHRLEGHTAGVLDVCFDDQHIVSCSKDTTICLWERSTGSLLRTLNGHRGPVNAVQLRGSHIVSASGDGVAKLWNISSGNCVKEFPSKDRGLACVEFSPDSRTILAGGNDKVIYQFDANTGELVRELSGHQGLVRSLHLDSVNGRVISGSYDYSVKAFDVQTGDMLCDFVGWTTSWMLSAKADYRRIVATSQDGRAVVMDFGHGVKDIELLES